MALVIFTHGEMRKSMRMFTPKKITSLPHWLKAARKKIKEIPDWPIEDSTANTRELILILRGPSGETAVVRFDRTVPGIGGS